MIDRILGKKVAVGGHRQDIVERTDGISTIHAGDNEGGLDAASERAVRGTAATVPALAQGARKPARVAYRMGRPDRTGHVLNGPSVGKFNPLASSF